MTTAYLRWSLFRAALAKGWWLATALYLVLVADLSPSQLVLIGVFQGLTVVVAEVPAGVLADAVSRRLALVVAHMVMGAGMAMTGLVAAFPLLVVSQCLWGLGWAISSGADVAWITDELDRFDLIDGVLTAQGRFDLIGTAVGIIVFGILGWATSLSAAIVVAGVSMIGLGLAMVARWPESHRRPDIVGRPLTASAAVLRRGVAVARADRIIVLVLGSTLLVNGGAEGFGRLFERRLIAVGVPTAPDPIVWFAALALVAAAIGTMTLLFVPLRRSSDRRRRRRQAHLRRRMRDRNGRPHRLRSRTQRGVSRCWCPTGEGHRIPGCADRSDHSGQPSNTQRGARDRPLDAVPSGERRRDRLRPGTRRLGRRHVPDGHADGVSGLGGRGRRRGERRTR